MRRTPTYLFVITSAVLFLIGYRATSHPRPTQTVSAVIRQDATPEVLRSAPADVDLSNADTKAIEREITLKDRLFTVVCEAAFDASNKGAALDQIDLHKLANTIRGNLHVQVERRDGASELEFRVALRDRYAELIAAVTNRLAHDFVATRNQAIDRSAKRQYKSARDQLNEAKLHLGAAEAEAAEYSEAQLPANEAADAVVPPKIIDESEPEATKETEARQTESLLEGQLAELQRRRVELLLERTPLHPLVRDVDALIAQLTERISVASDKRIVAAQLDLPPYPPTPNVIPTEPAEQAVDSPVDSSGLKRRLAAVERARKAYDEVSIHERAALEDRIRSSQARLSITETAVVPASRSGMRRFFGVGMSMLLAVGCGAVLAFSGTHARPLLNNVADIERSMGLPVVGHVSSTQAPTTRPSVMRRAVPVIRIFSELALLALLAWFVYLFAVEPHFRENLQHNVLRTVSDAIGRLPFFNDASVV